MVSGQADVESKNNVYRVFLSEHMGQIIIAIIIAIIIPVIFGVSYLFRVTLVNQFVVPTVKETLKNEKFLRDEIAEGKFVVVDQNEFAKNHVIQHDYIEELADGKYSKLVENIEKEKILPIEKRAKELENRIGDIEAIHKAESEGSIKVHLYESKQDADQDLLVLDPENSAIGHWLKNGHFYQLNPLSGDGKKECVKLRLDKGILDKRADGRLYDTQFHELFSGSTSRGLGNASIELKSEVCKK